MFTVAVKRHTVNLPQEADLILLGSGRFRPSRLLQLPSIKMTQRTNVEKST